MSTPPQVLPPPPADWLPERDRLLREKEQLAAENRVLELKVQKLQRMLWDRKSERRPLEDKQSVLFEEPAEAKSEATVTTSTPTHKPTAATRPPKGPKPLDPALPREAIQVPAPELKELICPVTQQPRQPGFVERIEVLARRAPEYYVKAYERTVFVSPAKTAPVYAPWPADILPRSRVHASVVGHLAAAHYSEHLPYHRIEQQLARTGVELPRSSQVSLMRQLDELVAPLLVALKAEVFGHGYVHVDATPVEVWAGRGKRRCGRTPPRPARCGSSTRPASRRCIRMRRSRR